MVITCHGTRKGNLVFWWSKVGQVQEIGVLPGRCTDFVAGSES